MKKKFILLGAIPFLSLALPVSFAAEIGPRATANQLPPRYILPEATAVPAELAYASVEKKRFSVSSVAPGETPQNLPPPFPFVLTRSNPGQQQVEEPRARMNDPHDYIHNAGALMEYELQNQQGDRIGTVNDFVIDLDTGQIEFIAVGPGEPFRLIPPHALEPMPADQRLVLDIDADRWEQAPSATRQEIDRLVVDGQIQQIYSFYGLDHYPTLAQMAEPRVFGAREERTGVHFGPHPTESAPPRSEPALLPPDMLPRDPTTSPRVAPLRPPTPEAAPGSPDPRPADPFASRIAPGSMPPDRLPGDPVITRAEPEILPPDRTGVDRDLRTDREFGTPREREMPEEREARPPMTEQEVREREILRQREERTTLDQPRLHHSSRGIERPPYPTTAPGLRTEVGDPEWRGTDALAQDKLTWSSDLLGQSAVGRDQQPIGEVTDLIVDLHVGYIQHVIVTHEGRETTSFAIPVNDITIGEDGRVIVHTDLSALENAPPFEERQARLRRFEPFRYDQAGTPEFAAPPRDPQIDGERRNGPGEKQ